MSIRISIVIPVFEEGAHISRTLDALAGLDGIDQTEIIVVDGHPAATTLKAVAAESVRGILAPCGRGAQMHAGARAAAGSVLVFLHADTRLEKEGLVRIQEALGCPGVVGGAFDLGIEASGAAYRLIEWGASLRSRLTRIPYGDQVLFLRRDFYLRIGGFRAIPLMEDVDLMRRIRRARGRLRFLPARAWTSARRWQQEGILYCTLRNYTLMILYLFGVSPARLVRFYQTPTRRRESVPKL